MPAREKVDTRQNWGLVKKEEGMQGLYLIASILKDHPCFSDEETSDHKSLSKVSDVLWLVKGRDKIVIHGSSDSGDYTSL